MSTTPHHLQSLNPIPAEVRQQAAEWLVELQSEKVSENTRRHWQAWRDAHPDHARAWQRIEAFGDRLHGLSSPLAHAALTASDNDGRRRAIKTLAVMLFAGGSVWMVREQSPWQQWTADKSTGVGQRESITLTDGTRIALNAQTSIDIRYTETHRVVKLLRGEILITTAHDPQAMRGNSRPFLVETAQGSIRALGTRFLVQQHDDQHGESRVAVYEGAVEIKPQTYAGARVLNAGQQTTFSNEGFGAVDIADDAATAWMQGMIVAQDMPLVDFLKMLGRYRSGHIACDAAVSKLKVTGTYPLADTDKVLDMLRTTLPVDVRFLTRYWVTVQATKT